MTTIQNDWDYVNAMNVGFRDAVDYESDMAKKFAPWTLQRTQAKRGTEKAEADLIVAWDMYEARATR